MRITTKGQVTIPQDIREKAGLLPNTEVVFEFTRGRVTLTPVPGASHGGRSLSESLRGSAGKTPKGMTTDALMKLLRN
jgi:AbrB family looped-hinge helix DNA binding protein